MLLGKATPEATERYAARFGDLRATGFFRLAQGLNVSTLGIGSYLGDATAEVSLMYADAIVAALRGGINFIDTSLNYRHQRSERAIGQAIYRLADERYIDRDQYLICTKAGYLVPDAVPKSLKSDEVVGGMHCLSPDFIADQLERSRVNLGLETVDVMYLHNPETQLAFISREQFRDRIRAAFTAMEQMAADGKIQYYGMATWEGFRRPADHPEGLQLTELAEIARAVAGDHHRFRFVQLPFNLGMTEALSTANTEFDGRRVSALAAAEHYGICVVASATLLQTRLLKHVPDQLRARMPGVTTNAQACIQFTRSTPGIVTALVGMAKAEHVAENLGIAKTAPLPYDRYLEFYRKAS